jgi:hypothetical protein
MVLAACASSIENLQFATATTIGGHARPESIAITDVRRGATEVNWVAAAPNHAVYACHADDMLRRPQCSRR